MMEKTQNKYIRITGENRSSQQYILHHSNAVTEKTERERLTNLEDFNARNHVNETLHRHCSATSIILLGDLSSLARSRMDLSDWVFWLTC